MLVNENDNQGLISKLLKPIEVARILDISRSMAYRLLSHGEIPVIRIGKSVRVRKEDLEEFIEKSWSGWDPR